jgi:hypothetical protein
MPLAKFVVPRTDHGQDQANGVARVIESHYSNTSVPLQQYYRNTTVFKKSGLIAFCSEYRHGDTDHSCLHDHKVL